MKKSILLFLIFAWIADSSNAGIIYGTGTNGPNTRDANWFVLASFPAFVPPSGQSYPYRAYSYGVVPLNWNGNGGWGQNQVGYSNSDGTFYWIGPQATSDSALPFPQQYGYIIGQSFVASRAGQYNFSFAANGDNLFSFFINGSISTNDPMKPTITNGTQIGQISGDFQNIKTNTGTAYLNAGTNWAYAVIDERGFSTGLLVAQSTFTFIPPPSITAVPGGTVVTGTDEYSSVTYETNGKLIVDPGAQLTITSPVIMSNNSTTTVNGTFIAESFECLRCSIVGGSGTMIGNFVNGGRLRPGNSPGTITINGNFSQTTTGMTEIEVGPSNFDRIVVNGAVNLGGGLEVSTYGGGVLNYGTQYQFLSASQGINGTYEWIAAPAGYRARFYTTSNQTQGVFVIAPQSYTQMAASPNQLSVAKALDTFIPGSVIPAPSDCNGPARGVVYSQTGVDSDKSAVSLALDKLTAGEYAQAFATIAPTLYQSLSTMAFNTVNAQYNDLVEQMFGLRVAGTGFSMKGFGDNYAVIQEVENKGVLDAKKDVLNPVDDDRWGMFVDGNGIFAQANSGNILQSYNFQSGGVIGGLTYKWNPAITTGIYAGYEGTYSKFGYPSAGSVVIDNAVRFGLLGTFGDPSGKGFYGDALIGGSYHNYNVTRNITFSGLSRTANSSPGAGELDSLIAMGYNWRKGNWAFGPVSSLQYTYFGMNAFNETGAQSLDYKGLNWNTASMIYNLGANCAYAWQANRDLMVVPQINLAWQHEFLQNPYAINGTLSGVSVVTSSSTPLRDTLYTGVGVTFEYKKNWNTAFFYNAAAGNSDLRSQNIFWSAGLKF